jgi:hypothetical protein
MTPEQINKEDNILVGSGPFKDVYGEVAEIRGQTPHLARIYKYGILSACQTGFWQVGTHKNHGAQLYDECLKRKKLRFRTASCRQPAARLENQNICNPMIRFRAAEWPNRQPTTNIQIQDFVKQDFVKK